MIYGVFSDIHGNLEALDAVLGFFSKSGVKSYLCCGDIVGYGPQPNECVERLRGLKPFYVVCGNHDMAVLGTMDVMWFNGYARAAALWTREKLSPESRGYLAGLNPMLEDKKFTIAHGAPRKPPEEYLLSVAQFKDNIPFVKVWPLFVGHSHMPLCFKVCDAPPGVESIFLEDGQVVEVARGAAGGATAFNPGSVGQPRDQDPRASCALYDSEKGTFRVARVPYDIAAVQAKIRAAELPEFLALRLAFGQ